MWARLPLRGTLLNTTTVVVGSLIGLALGQALPGRLQDVALMGIGLVTLALGFKMFLETRNVLVLAGSIVLGGVIGALAGIDAGLLHAADWVRHTLGGGGTFNEGLITASLLYCVGPMTLLGCIQDGLERRIELLGIKSLLDGVASVFLAAALGVGVLVSAAVVLIVQGALTLAARPLRGVAERPDVMAEATAAGGILLLAVGLGLLGLGRVDPALYLPALLLAPVAAAWLARRNASSGTVADAEPVD